MSVAASGTLYTVKPRERRKLLTRASAVVLPAHGPPVSTILKHSGGAAVESGTVLVDDAELLDDADAMISGGSDRFDCER